MNTMTDTETAYHEAAPAVAYMVSGQPFLSVTLEPDERNNWDVSGCVRVAPGQRIMIFKRQSRHAHDGGGARLLSDPPSWVSDPLTDAPLALAGRALPPTTSAEAALYRDLFAAVDDPGDTAAR
jgi:hypothetical protein